MTTRQVSGIITDVHNRRQYPGVLQIENGRISEIRETTEAPERYILPGFIDSHIHIESSMLVPSEFARLAVSHGTVATVSDPHEIANVCGIEGVRYMIANGAQVPLKFFFGAPSCVPATGFETAGATLDARDVAGLLDRDDILYLAEMMNWPGVLDRDEQVMTKIGSALERGKPVDGHAPGLAGSMAHLYASAGISTDHECVAMDEALDKIRAGMLIAIREGSAARNFEALIGLMKDHPGRVMFCSDDKHPDDLLEGHINRLAARAIAKGYDLYDVLRSCSVVPAEHYRLPVGLLRPGDPADFIIASDLESFTVEETWIDGTCVYGHGEVHFPRVPVEPRNRFEAWTVHPEYLHARTGTEMPQPDGVLPHHITDTGTGTISGIGTGTGTGISSGTKTGIDTDTGSGNENRNRSETDSGTGNSTGTVSGTGINTVDTNNTVSLSRNHITVPVIIAFDGELITGRTDEQLGVSNGLILPDTGRDILKIVVVNRYRKAPPAVAFIRNFGIKNGAIASSVAHDSHNIIAVGSTDQDISRAVNLIMESRGGIAAVSGNADRILPLPVAGIMSDRSGGEVAAAYQELNRMATGMGCKLKAPFMTISFMALLVIPRLKISDLGLFDAEAFRFIRQPGS